MNFREKLNKLSLNESFDDSRYPTKLNHDDLRKAAKSAGIDEEKFIKFWWAVFKNDTDKNKTFKWAKMIAEQPIDYSTNNKDIMKAYKYAGF